MLNHIIQRVVINLIFMLLFVSMVQATETDLVILVDSSGSMKQHDPQFFLRQVILSFTNQLGQDTNLALFDFTDEVHILLPLSTSSVSQERIHTALQRITYSGLRTDIAAAVERALYLLKNESRPHATKAILLLTDGYMDTGNNSRNQDKTRWLLRELSDDCVENYIRLFGIAFTEGADYQLLQSLAWRTRGDYFRVFDFEGMNNAFNRIKEQIIPLAPAIPPLIITPVPPVVMTTQITSPPPLKNSSLPEIPIPLAIPAEPAIDAKKVIEETLPKTITSNHENILLPSVVPTPPTAVIIKSSASQPLPPSPQVSITAIKKIPLNTDINSEEVDADHLGWKLSLFLFIVFFILEVKKHYIYLLTIMQEWIKRLRDYFRSRFVVDHISSELKNFNLANENGNTDNFCMDNAIVTNLQKHNDKLHQTVKFQLKSHELAKDSKKDNKIEKNIDINEVILPKRSSQPSSSSIVASVLAKLVDQRGEQGLGEFPLTRSITMVTRSTDFEPSNIAYLYIDASTISRRHALIEFRNFAFWLQDLGSTNGTYVNRRQITQEVKLKNNDFIQFHTFGFNFIFFTHDTDEHNATYCSDQFETCQNNITETI